MLQKLENKIKKKKKGDSSDFKRIENIILVKLCQKHYSIYCTYNNFFCIEMYTVGEIKLYVLYETKRSCFVPVLIQITIEITIYKLQEEFVRKTDRNRDYA